jgi:hypothetical protein
MSRIPIEEVDHKRILDYLLNPESLSLSDSHKVILERYKCADNILCKYPQYKTAMKLYKVRFPDLDDSQIYRDFDNAKRLFCNFEKFDKEWIRRWVINDIFKLIEAAKSWGPKGFKTWIAAQANLIKAVGLDHKDDIQVDPEILQAHQFYMIINVDGRQVKADFEAFQALPALSRKELSDAIFTRTMTEDTAAELLSDGT